MLAKMFSCSRLFALIQANYPETWLGSPRAQAKTQLMQSNTIFFLDQSIANKGKFAQMQANADGGVEFIAGQYKLIAAKMV